MISQRHVFLLSCSTFVYLPAPALASLSVALFLFFRFPFFTKKHFRILIKPQQTELINRQESRSVWCSTAIKLCLCLCVVHVCFIYGSSCSVALKSHDSNLKLVSVIASFCLRVFLSEQKEFYSFYFKRSDSLSAHSLQIILQMNIYICIFTDRYVHFKGTMMKILVGLQNKTTTLCLQRFLMFQMVWQDWGSHAFSCISNESQWEKHKSFPNTFY